ncbi:MAG: flagellar hook-length control protein FliK [Pseudomonadota bacterium]|nr:flagellar hook-length control protein FliK [Pseudomonadota bacterium]
MSLGRVLQAAYGSRLAISGDDSQYTLSYDTATRSLVLTVSTSQANQVIPVSASQDLMSLVVKYGALRLVTAESGAADALTFRGVIPTPQPTQVVLTYRFDMTDIKAQPALQISQRGVNERHPLFAAINRIDARQVNGALTQRLQPLIFDQTVLISPEPNRLENPVQLVRAVVASLPTIEGNKSMLIPDINPAMPRPIGPDALPNNVPISQPIAAELGLKPGQVVQALVANAGDKMALQLKNREIPLPSNLRLSEGQVQLRVMQGPQGLLLSFVGAQTVLASQAAAAGGISAALADILARPAGRSLIQGTFSPQTMESLLSSQGLDREARVLQNNRLDSNTLNAQAIARALKFGALNTERAVLDGVTLSVQTLKPWLRQILRLLPAQSEIASRLSDLISDVERFQLDAMPNTGNRDYNGMSALLLFRDQLPVELIFERFPSADDDNATTWVINVHTSLEHLGEIWMKSTFSRQDVDLVMWAVEPKTASLAKEAAIDLKEAFSEIGLTVQTIQILNSERTNFPDRGKPKHSNLDLQA